MRFVLKMQSGQALKIKEMMMAGYSYDKWVQVCTLNVQCTLPDDFFSDLIAAVLSAIPALYLTPAETSRAKELAEVKLSKFTL